ncbi:PP0621 family protein [Poseidonibacter antarcticus]|uniref:PP0621 family protein n=1 Tax=Poseidonibacter antarcticus TaxID=2478538 RepID=UPI000EF4FFFF|nr:PP0621 family protein [Poseidonibacter antarcticus]
MILKTIAILVVLFIVYILFFKKNREKDIVKKKDIKYEDEMVECPTCGTYISTKESILSNGKYYCSKDCLENK